ncbi:MAG: hypoxanthine-guanine phosphoribosyltransferase [Pseudohongiellaceae bacterium]
MIAKQASEVFSRARCLHDERAVEAALDEMAAAISGKLQGENPLLLCVMNGGLITAGKLLTRLAFPLQVDYLHVSRYRDEIRGGEFNWHREPSQSLSGRVVLLVDDVLDEGATLEKVVAYCREQGCKKVYVAVLVEKLHDHKLSDLQADFVGLQTEDYYLVGYGMDYKGYWRNAAGIFAIDAGDC